MNKTIKYIITIVLTALAVASFILFELVHLTLIKDNAIANQMLSSVIYHFAIGALLLWLSYLVGNTAFLSLKNSSLKQLLWCLPCLLVALVNFPYAGVIRGDIKIVNANLIPLYIVYVISISLIEEIVFRGVLLLLLLDLFRNNKLKHFYSALISSLIFALFHFTNIGSMPIGEVLLQVLYTFLIGGMLAVTMLKVKNIWVCILLHAIFDFGGLMVYRLTYDSPMSDPVFWILTIACGILCAGHIIVTLINLERKHVS